ncbi:hypothetical protein FMZ60_16090 [Alcaligenaceae bacterium SJ-26]|nr:hypothetical protein FMZ60_16090 [Alcaligenaceae bacterium SJ-26]
MRMSINDHRVPVPAVREALSAARMETYERAVGGDGECNPAALRLYAWNADVSGALLPPLHVCEVVIRNVVSDALAAVYGVLISSQ